ncbi:MAG: hypothetical protein WCO10_00270 [bacterium]
MSANLLTEKQKIFVKNEFRLRLAVTVVFLVFLTSVNYLSYLIPYYISVVKKDRLVAEQFAEVITVENKENSGSSITQTVRRTNDMMKLVEIYGQPALVISEQIDKIISNKNSGIVINKISSNYLQPTDMQINISGRAKTRDNLTVFLQTLKSKAAFYDVKYPVSDFLKSNDIDFTINIRAKK